MQNRKILHATPSAPLAPRCSN